MYEQPKPTKAEQIRYLSDEVNDLRETMYRRESERDKERKSLNLLVFASFYCFLIGYIIGKRPPETDAD